VRILELPDPMPRAWLVHQAVSAGSEADILHQIASYQLDPRITVGLVGDAPQLSGEETSTADGVTITSYEPDRIALHVRSSGTGMVVLGEIWDPGWSATVDGESVEVYAANGIFRGVVVGPGEHTVVFTYPATLAKWSLLAWLIPVATLLAVAVPIWPQGDRDPVSSLITPSDK
jgi:hypothetical protein